MVPEIPIELLNLLQQVLGRSKGRHAALAGDIWAVALGMRTGLLIDTLLVEEERARRLAVELPKLDTFLGQLVVLYESDSSQTFILNRVLLLLRICGAPPLLLDVGGSSPRLLHAVPLPLRLLLETITESSASSSFVLLILPTLQHTSLLIALAGFLLEYPVVYWLGDSNSNCLGGRDDLMLVRALLLRNDQEPHTFLAFSFPSSVEGVPPAAEVREQLETVLRRRLRALGVGSEEGWTGVDVVLEGPVFMERFAL